LEKINEKEIIRRLSEGDKISFGMLFNVYYERLFRFALHYLNNEESAKDVVQDVFGHVWEKHVELLKVNNLSSWLFSITKNQCLKKIDHIKVVQKHSDVLKNRQLDIVRAALNELDTSPLIFGEIKKIIDSTLVSLSPKARRIFEMSRFENKKNREISEELGISIKTVEANMSRTLKIFKSSLKPYLPLVLYFLH
jgi:RNA polymerase sigma-70 factor (ECF subfamily)